MSKKSKMSNKDLDALLNDAADSLLESKPAPPQTVAPSVPSEVKPWLAASANAPKELRDKWNQFVKTDRQAVLATRLQPSQSYRSWDSQPINTGKLLGDLVKKATSKASLDEAKTSRVLSTLTPTAETEYSRRLSSAYATQVISDLRELILADPNYDPEKFPNLNTVLTKG